MTETKIKMLALDIETAPIVAYVWGLWDQNVGLNQIKETGRIICFSAQWYGSKTVIFYSEYHHSREEMLEALWNLLNEADVVAGWNSDGFDIPWIEGELQDAGYGPPSPFYKLDLMKHFRRRTRYPSKKLAFVSERVLGDTKLTHTGFQLWRDCIEPDVDPEVKRKAWNLMRRYAKKDTALLWPIYETVKGWIKLPLPMILSDDGETRCRCGSQNFQRRGWSSTGAMTYRRFHCQDCGAWFKSMAAGDKHSNGTSRQI